MHPLSAAKGNAAVCSFAQTLTNTEREKKEEERALERYVGTLIREMLRRCATRRGDRGQPNIREERERKGLTLEGKMRESAGAPRWLTQRRFFSNSSALVMKNVTFSA